MNTVRTSSQETAQSGPLAALLALFDQQDRRVLWWIALSACTSSLIEVGLLAIINYSTSAAGVTPHSLRQFIVFVLLLGLFFISHRFTFYKTAAIFQNALYRLNLTIVTELEDAEYYDLEGLGISEILDGTSESLTVISDSASTLVTCIQSFAMVIFISLYMASISMIAFLLTSGLVSLGVFFHIFNAKRLTIFLREAGDSRLRFFEGITDVLYGSKELKFNKKRGEDLRCDIEKSAVRLKGITERTRRMAEDNSLFATCVFFMLLGAASFLTPQFQLGANKSTTSLITGIIFLMGPLTSVVMGIPTFSRVNLASENIQNLLSKLRANSMYKKTGAEFFGDPWTDHRNYTLQANAITYTYQDGHVVEGTRKDTFSIGPVTLHIPQGTIVFIVGGNGSGKSTLLKALTSLYPIKRGSLEMGGILVDEATVLAYRQRFSVIFSDFHLFKKAYGLGPLDTERLNELIEQMGLGGKTAFKNGIFTNLDLSTGQRKRLAMVIALAEDRPIYAFDEWAADQDPEFRHYFYRELLPEMKVSGKTVIVVTHDDRYFDCADQLVTLEYGAVRSIQLRTN